MTGTANTIVGGVRRTVSAGGSLDIPRATMYQVSNVGMIRLEILEVRIDAAPIEELPGSREEFTEIEKKTREVANGQLASHPKLSHVASHPRGAPASPIKQD